MESVFVESYPYSGIGFTCGCGYVCWEALYYLSFAVPPYFRSHLLHHPSTTVYCEVLLYSCSRNNCGVCIMVQGLFVGRAKVFTCEVSTFAVRLFYCPTFCNGLLSDLIMGKAFYCFSATFLVGFKFESLHIANHLMGSFTRFHIFRFPQIKIRPRQNIHQPLPQNLIIQIKQHDTP